MTPLPRLLAYLDQSIAVRDDIGVGLAAISAAGPDVAIVVRNPGASADQLAELTRRAVANARPPGARVLVSGRSDIAMAYGADGVVLRRNDLPAREVADSLIALASVHSADEAREAVSEGAHGLVVGTIWPTASHPGRPAAGLDLIRAVAALGVPVYAIGGVTPERAREAVAAGAWGVAAIGAIWHASRQYAATRTLIESLGQVTRFQGQREGVDGAANHP